MGSANVSRETFVRKREINAACTRHGNSAFSVRMDHPHSAPYGFELGACSLEQTRTHHHKRVRPPRRRTTLEQVQRARQALAALELHPPELVNNEQPCDTARICGSGNTRPLPSMLALTPCAAECAQTRESIHLERILGTFMPPHTLRNVRRASRTPKCFT